MNNHLQHAQGYLELGMLEDANNALDEIEPTLRATPEVLGLRLQIFIKAQKWQLVQSVAKHLSLVQPENAIWFVEWANATRRLESVEAAQKILISAEAKRHPNDAAIQYNLGCYAAVLGNLEEAKKRIPRAIELDKRFQKIALDDPDLDSLWPVWKLGEG